MISNLSDGLRRMLGMPDKLYAVCGNEHGLALWAGEQTWSRFSKDDSCRFRSITESCPYDFAAQRGYRQFRSRLFLVESCCDFHLGLTRSRYGRSPSRSLAICGGSKVISPNAV